MDLARATSNRKSSQLQSVVVVQAEKLMIAYGAHAYEEARRRRFWAGSASAARHWLRVKAEIGRRLSARRDDAAEFNREEARPCGFDPAPVGLVALGPRASQATDSFLCGFPNLEGRPTAAARESVTDSATDQVPGERRTARLQAEADMRAAMKAGDLDGVRSALSRLAPSAPH